MWNLSMTYDRVCLESQFRAKTRASYLFFWGHQAAKDGSVTSSCFSQWWPAAFDIEGTSYQTAEHWMMAGKARLFGDEATALEICRAGSPKQAKDLGRQVKGFVETVWDTHKRSIVTEGNLAKFSQNHALKNFLLETGDKVLVEASPVDRIWGIGLAADHDDAHNPLKWRGENLLGFILMDVRERLRT